MNSAAQLSRLALYSQRSAYNFRMANQLQAKQNQQELGLFYDGYSDGQHWGKAADGSRYAVQPQSNGALAIGDAFRAGAGGGAVRGWWMPR